MTNEEILHKAIEKAEKKGYHTPFVWISDRGKEILKDMAREGNTSCYSIIFSHNFAKAFWGEGSAEEQYKKLDEYWHDTGCCSGSGCFFRGKNWQYHLQQMVLEKEPLKYIEKFL